MQEHVNFLAPYLPIEILDMILQFIPASSIPVVLLSNSLVYSLGCRVLYRDIADQLPARQLVSLLKTLTTPSTNRPSRLPLPSTYVHSLYLDFSHNHVSSNLLRLIRRALSCLPRLTDLHLELSLSDSRYPLGWVLADCTAQLERFSTSLRCDTALACFLETQPRIQELSLRGFQLNDSSDAFVLSPRALPRLSSILVVHAGVPVLRTVVTGRPIIHAGVTLFREDADGPGFCILDAIVGGTCPLKRLTLLTLDDTTTPDEIIQAVTSRMPDLEALHIVALFASYSVCNLFAAALYLKQMHQLKYLTFMAGEPADSGHNMPHTIENERRVVGAWGNACPSLRTVILPKGELWYEQQGKWLSNGE